MSLYDEASLVMIPSGYKEDKLYSIKPTSGDGDFTFSRGTDTATRVNASGLIEKERGNLLLQSNSFDTSWIIGASSVLGGQSGYDGSSDAWELIEDTNNNQHYIQQAAASVGVVQCVSVYAKANTRDWLMINQAGIRRAYYDLSNGVMGSIDGNVIDASITSIGNGWYRCDYVANMGYSVIRIGVTTGDGVNAYTGDGSSSIYIQDAQLEQGLVATDYIETTTAAVYEGITDNLPRLDYSGGASCPSLLLEPQRTNIFVQSEYFTGGDWDLNSGTTLTDNYATSPEGVQNATRYVGTGASGFGDKFTLTNGTQYTISAYVKSNTGATQYCRLIGDSSNISSDLEVTTEWTRIDYTWTSGGLTSKTNGIFRDSSNNDIDILVYGAQLESGSYATSYIPTYGTSATRAKDSAEATGLGSSLGSTEGTIFLEVSALTNDLSERRFALSNGTTGNVARVGFTNVSNRILAVLYNGSNQCVLAYEGADITQTNKIAFTYAANDFALYVNGESRRTDTSGSTFTAGTLTEVHFNEGDGNGNESYGNFKQVVIFPTRLTNAQLASLTTL